jgi:hypothetical protein
MRAKEDTVSPYAPPAPLVVTTVTPEANRPAAFLKAVQNRESLRARPLVDGQAV